MISWGAESIGLVIFRIFLEREMILVGLMYLLTRCDVALRVFAELFSLSNSMSKVLVKCQKLYRTRTSNKSLWQTSESVVVFSK